MQLSTNIKNTEAVVVASKPQRLMIQILRYLKDPKLWEFCYIPYYGKCRIYIISRITMNVVHA